MSIARKSAYIGEDTPVDMHEQAMAWIWDWYNVDQITDPAARLEMPRTSDKRRRDVWSFFPDLVKRGAFLRGVGGYV